MGKPVTLLEDICRHSLGMGAGSIEVEHKDKLEWVTARTGDVGIVIARFPSSGREGTELRENLAKALKKPVRTVLNARVYILNASVTGEDAFKVMIDPAPKADASKPPSFTAKQGQYLVKLAADDGAQQRFVVPVEQVESGIAAAFLFHRL